MFHRLFIPVVLAAAAAVPAFAQTASPSASFGVLESVSHADLSPSGRYLVYIQPVTGTNSVAMIVDLEGDRRAVPFVRSSGDPERLRWCRFASDTRLICSIYGLSSDQGQLIPFSRVFAINPDGSNIRQLGQRPSFFDERIRQFDAQILDWLGGEEGTILMAREYVPEARTTDTRLYRREDGLGVDRVNLTTLRTTTIEPANRLADGYVTDGRGNVRIMRLARVDSDSGQADPTVHYRYRLAGSNEWRELGRYNTSTDQGMVPLAVDAGLNAAYVLKKLNGRFALYRIRLDETLAEELVYANEAVDVDDVVRIGRSGSVIGVTFADEQRRIVYFDPEYERLARSLSRAIPQLPLVTFAGSSRDNRKLLIFAGSDTDPGRYYLFDRDSRQMNELMLARPELEGTRLSPVRAVTYPAADGVAIPAYLTLPPGREEARGLPAVVLPHGGPAARDEWGFDWLAQYFAQRGYAVLQPNFRGSGGYGDAWLAGNGFRGWATSIGDVTAGARWLATQGIADPRRMAIVGWSYGGYAALQSGVADPDLFRAIVAIAPVTDLRLLTQQYRGFTNYRQMRAFVGEGAHLEQGSPARNAGRIAAPVLLFHGTRDFNVSVDHAQMMQRALQDAGKTSQLVVFQGLEHDLGDSAARTRMLEQIGQFLGQHLGSAGASAGGD